MAEETLFTNRMTLETMKWIFYRRYDGEFMQIQEPNDIKKIIMKYISPWFSNDDDKQKFIKGAKLIDVNAMFDWVCIKRGFAIQTKDIGLNLLRSLKVEYRES